MTSVHGTSYVFDTAEALEHERLLAHSELWDPFTFRKLAETGVGDGWRCLEIGAGAGSVAAWLVHRVGPRGQVVATDIETRWLEPMAAANLEVRHHNVAADPLEESGYDLIHARLVLEHLPQRQAVARKLAAALRPGGWLVVEDYDIRTMGLAETAPPSWALVNEAVVDVLRAAGSDPLCGSQLAGLLQRSGLVDVLVEGFLRPMPIPDLAPIFRRPLEQLRRGLEAGGAVTAGQIDDALAAFDDDGDDAPRAYTPILVAASGRAPARPR